MLRGLTTINFFAADLTAAKEWYSEFLGVEPYFQVPGYIEFRIGDYKHEFGIIDAAYAPHDTAVAPGGSILYWAVDDLSATVERLIALGAKEHEPIRERGEGFVTASVVDPFGNILGVMTNVHYHEVLDSLTH
jgi:predicted enzyme related to lactoylglutathione lyase